MKNFDLSALTPKERALELLFSHWQPHPESSVVSLDESRGRVLTEDTFAKYTLPVVRAAEMDSVALRSADFAGGAPDTSGWKRGVEFDRADMGDDFDDHFDATVPVENVEFLPDGGIRLHGVEELHPGDGIRAAGTTVLKKEPLLSAGTRLGPVEMGVLAAGGITEVRCWKKPVVAVIPTGSELVARGQVPRRGENIDSNSLMLREMLADMGAEPLCFPIVRDAPGQMAGILKTALERADLVVVNAGSSKGEEDFSTRLLKTLGTFLFHEVAAVPGRPLSIAVADNKPVINLPGPPLAAFNGADWCIRAAVAYYLHTVPEEPVTIRAVLTDAVDAPAGLRFTLRVQVYRENGTVYAKPIPRGSCSMTRSMAANGVYISPVGTGRVVRGAEIDAMLLRGIELREK